jgi:hypothetical protein
VQAITTERAIDTNPTGGDRAARQGDVTAEGAPVEARDALRIRPLIEHPALRLVMGLDTVQTTTDAGLPTRRAGTHRSAALAWPARAVAIPALVPTAARPRAAAPVRRFDRRALLESAT